MTHYRTQIDDVLETVDILITPSTPIVAPKIGAVEVETEGLTEPVGNAMMRFTNFFNTTCCNCTQYKRKILLSR